MNKSMVLAMAAFLLLPGCDHTDKELKQAKYVAYQAGLTEGKRIGFKEGEQSVSKTAELIVAQIKMKNEVLDSQRELALEKALACSYLPINICPDSWMLDIESFQKAGYSGIADRQFFWITLAGWLIPTLLLTLFLFFIAFIYKFLKLRYLVEENQNLNLIRDELNLGNSKLNHRIANFTAEENQAMAQVKRNRAIEEEIHHQIQIDREEAERDLEYFRSESLREAKETNAMLAALQGEIDALKAQKNLFGG